MNGWAARFCDAFDSHEGSRVAALVTSDIRWEDVAAGIIFDNPDALAAFVDDFCDQFSKDYRFTLVSEQVTATRYTVEWEMAGTNTGVFQGAPPTNKSWCIRGVSVGTFDADGKIKQNREYYNVAALLQQLGVRPVDGA